MDGQLFFRGLADGDFTQGVGNAGQTLRVQRQTVEHRATDALVARGLALPRRAGLLGLRLDPLPLFGPDALLADEVVTGWFDREMLDTFLAIKREEIARAKGRSEADICADYRDVY